MIIGLDIDGVMIDDDSYILDYMTKYCFENDIPNLDNPYAFENKCDWTDVVINDYREKYFFNYIRNSSPRRFVSEITHKLHEDGHKIVVITARYKTKEDSEIGKQMREDTKKWLDKNNIYYDKICFAVSPKIKEVVENSVDIMIDDSPEVIPEISKVTHVFCFDNRYNKDLKCSNVTRVFSWYDIYRKIKELR